MSESRKQKEDRRLLQEEVEEFEDDLDDLVDGLLSKFCIVSEPIIGSEAKAAVINYLEQKRRSMELAITASAKLASTFTCTLKDAGILKKTLRDGEGVFFPSFGSTVTIHSTVSPLDGTMYDSTKDLDVPQKCTVGDNKAIKALEIAVGTMSKGEIATFVCADKYAVEKTGFPPNIPPDGFLKFNVEMIDFTGEDISPDLSGEIEMFQSPTDQSHPAIGSIVDVHLIGKYNDTVFEERDVKFELGVGYEFGVIEGVEIGLEKMHDKSTAIFKIKSEYAFGEAGKPEFGVPSNAEVVYTIHLKNFETVRANFFDDS